MPELLVAPVSAVAARYAVEHWHYSRTVPVGPAMRFGVWEDGRYIGCVLFGRGASPYLGPRLGFSLYEVCELTRIALSDHDAPVSQIAARAVARLRRASPGTRVIVSFADPYRGHHGGIYQAMNWLYLGETAPAQMYRDRVTGQLHHQRVMSRRRVVRQFGRDVPGIDPTRCDIVKVPGKHRYALPLDRGARRCLLPHCLPYPSAVEVSVGDTPAYPAGEAGSSPVDRSYATREATRTVDQAAEGV